MFVHRADDARRYVLCGLVRDHWTANMFAAVAAAAVVDVGPTICVYVRWILHVKLVHARQLTATATNRIASTATRSKDRPDSIRAATQTRPHVRRLREPSKQSGVDIEHARMLDRQRGGGSGNVLCVRAYL